MESSTSRTNMLTLRWAGPCSSSSPTSGRCFIIHKLLSILLLCTFLLAPESQSLLHQKGLREANFQWWEQKKQLPQNWGHSNGENKIQRHYKQMKLHAEDDDNEYFAYRWYKKLPVWKWEKKRRKSLLPLWGKRSISSSLQHDFLFTWMSVEVRAFSRRPV